MAKREAKRIANFMDEMMRERDEARALYIKTIAEPTVPLEQYEALEARSETMRAVLRALREALAEYRVCARDCRCGAMGDALAKETT